MAYIGRPASTTVSAVAATDTFTGNGATQFQMSRAVNSNNPSALEVFVSNVQQQPTVTYTISGNVITFTEAPANGEPIYVIFRDYPTAPIFTIPDNSITADKIQPDAVVTAKIQDSAVSETKIASGAVVEGKLAANAVTETKIAANAITSVKIAANAVTTVQIAANSITASQIAPGAIPPSIPTGTLAVFAGDPGAGWLEANGQVVSQVTYSDLYSKVGLLVDGFKTSSVAYQEDPGTNNQTHFRCLAYGNSTYVIGMRDNTNAFRRHNTSTDGITWTARSIGWVSGVSDMNAVIYTDKFVAGFAVGGTAATNRNSIATSTDGITWTTRTNAATGSVVSLAYGNSVHVCSFSSTSANQIATSTDAITWTLRTAALSTASTNLVAYGSNVFVLVGQSASSTFPIIQTSTDGITWTYRSFIFGNSYFSGLSYENDKFYLWGDSVYDHAASLAYSSTDGITWSALTSLSKHIPIVQSIRYDSSNNQLFAAGRGNIYYPNGGKILVSKDNGVNWQESGYGVLLLPTTTSGRHPHPGIQPAPYLQSMYNNSNPFRIINNRIIFGGAAQFTNDATNSYFNVGIILSTPIYTYQTDTQFVVPWVSSPLENSGVPNGIGGLEYSTAINTTAGPVKWYIKT